MLSKSQKLNKIINHVKEEGISAYSISKATNISEAGLGKILNKVSKNPQERTVDVIYNYLFKEELSEEIKEIKGKKDFKTLNIDAKLDEIHNLLQILRESSEEIRKTGENTKEKVDHNEQLIGQTNKNMFEQSMNIQEVLDELEEKSKSVRKLS